MDFAFSEEQDELRRYAIQWLGERAASTEVRRISETDEGFDPTHWKELAEMGWLGMAIPEDDGGAGFGFLEQAVLLEEQGASLFPSPFFSTTVMGANALMWAGSPQQRSEWLPRIASGEAVVALAISDDGNWEAESIGTLVTQRGGDLVLTGSKAHVLDGHVADLMIVAARDDDGLALIAVPTDLPGIECETVSSMDPTRKQARVRLTRLEVPPAARMNGSDNVRIVLDRLHRRAAVALAIELVGGAQRCLDMAVSYARTRQQFGRPIGSFQAIKHMCADMFVAVESARAAAYYAAWTESEDNEEAPRAASLAKAHCSEAAYRCAADNIQIHGGIGFTWEHDAHLYFKRAATSLLMFGSPADHRRRLAAQVGIE